MDIEKFTERARGFIQSAQGLALRSGNQQFTPEHLLKVLLDDEEGLAARLINAAGGNDAAVRAGSRRRRWRNCPRSRAARARSIWRRRPRGCWTTPNRRPRRRATVFVTAEYLLLALAMATGTRAGAHPEGCRRHRRRA